MVINIGNKRIGPGNPCFVVAEISGNHRQSFSEAVKLIKAAKQAGADAVKLQTYTPDTITIDSDKKWFQVGQKVGSKDSPDAWKGLTLYELFKTAYTPWAWQPKLKRLADSLGLIFFSSVFDETSVDFLEKMHVPCYKIASYEVTDIPLLKKVARTGKPVIISVGFASREDVQLAVATLKNNGAKGIAVLHCVTAYARTPNPEYANLKTMQDIQKRFKVVTGFSDNNAGIEIPLAAAGAGASIIEKHLILKRSKGGPDARFSIEPAELKEMIDRIRYAEKAMGKVLYGPATEAEKNYKKSRKSLFVVQDMKKGELFTRANVRSIRPGFGLHPKFLDQVIGRKASKNIARGTPLAFDLVV